MLPTYPNFKGLELNDKEDICLITSRFLPFSDFNFASLYSYNVNNTFQISSINNNLLVLMEDYLTNIPFYSILGDWQISETFEILSHSSIYVPNKPLLRLVPETVLKNNRRMLRRKFFIEPDPDNYDYIISVKNLVQLSGKKYNTKRQKVNQFKKSYPNYKIELIDINNPRVQHAILDLFLEWVESKSVSEVESAREYNALIRYFSIRKHINSVDIGLYVAGSMVGFTLNEITHANYYIGHFGKVNYSYTGAFQILEHETAIILSKYKCKYMNFEQDLGVAGLKESKLSWHPIKFLKKYTINLN
jgi:hypothetical protein